MRVFVVAIMIVAVSMTVQAQTQTCSMCHAGAKPVKADKFLKTASVGERALAVMDKGQVSNYLGNYGVLSNYLEYFNDAIHWPTAALTTTQYCYGLGLVVASRGNVVTSVLGGPSQRVDWTPKAGSRGKIFSGDVKTPAPDETPFLASSDNPDTWPEGYFNTQGTWIATPGKRQWPGHFRIELDSASPNYGKEVKGEFVSDRDIYCVFDDRENTNPKGSLGVEVEESAFSYGRPYAEDMLFWDFTIRNKSGVQLDSVYVGYYGIFRADFDNKDLINIMKGNPQDAHPNGDFVYLWDANNTKDGVWVGDPTPLGIVGLNVIETPKNMGVTDFHFFNKEVVPTVDEELWPIISSNPNDPNLRSRTAYFHGENRRFDTTHPDSMKVYFSDGANINYFMMTGPFSLAPNETVKSSVALIMGNSGAVPNKPDTSDLMKNQRVAQQMYKRKFQGSGAPQTPSVTAYPGDKKARIVWDAEAENSRDALTGKNDFEGYKLYRSDDLGKTWGTSITDAFGSVIGYKPIKIFDLVDGIKGQDPAFNQSLGDESGLKHSYVDENLLNGVEYWYCVTAYDKGNQDPVNLEQSYQSPLGHSTMQPNVVAVVPGVQAQNYVAPTYNSQVNPDGTVSPMGGICQGTVKIDVVRPDLITGDSYLVTFADSAKQVVGTTTSYILGFNLYRVSGATHDTTLVFYRHLFSDNSQDNLPIVDGFRLTVMNSPSGISSIGWTKVKGDTCTFDWRTGPVPKYKSLGAQVAQENIYTVDDFQITIDTTLTGGLMSRWYDYFRNTFLSPLQHLPLKVAIVTDPANPIDISNNTTLMDFATGAPWDTYRIFYYSPLGWDLIPGGKGFTPGSSGFFEKYADILEFDQFTINPVSHDTTYNGLWLQTNNFPDTYKNADGVTVTKKAVPPSHGDQFTIKTYKPFRKEIRYAFNLSKAKYDASQVVDLEKIRVVPDPYVVSNVWETNQYGKKLMFTHLLNQCRISIFTVAGDHIADVDHTDNKGYEFWDMRTLNGQYIAYGLYVYVVSVPAGQTKVGRFLVIK
ncbi:MAG: hypothetical protein NTV54_12740 [Ignavibacteriales bacterium]|nr:hypothetical protein [Ignavibacteriales bacterium]